MRTARAGARVARHCKVEHFLQGLGPYTVVAGTAAPFSVAVSPFYGNMLVVAPWVGPYNAIQQPLYPRRLLRYHVKFRITQLNTDDAAGFTLMAPGIGGSDTIGFVGSREETYDPAQRAFVVIGPEAYYFGTTHLDVGEWYQLNVEIGGLGESTATLIRISDGDSQQVGFTGDYSAATVNALRFYTDATNATQVSATQFADIHIC